MTTHQLLAFHKATTTKCRDIMRVKNHDYAGASGTTPFANFEACEQLGICSTEVGFMVRILDKIMRIKTFAQSGALKVKDEPATAACDDCVNYFILLKAWLTHKQTYGRINNKQIQYLERKIHHLESILAKADSRLAKRLRALHNPGKRSTSGTKSMDRTNGRGTSSKKARRRTGEVLSEFRERRRVERQRDHLANQPLRPFGYPNP